MESMEVESYRNLHTSIWEGRSCTEGMQTRKGLCIYHVGSDECGTGVTENKIRQLSSLRNMGVLLKGLSEYDDYRILVLPDHATPG